MEKGRRMGCGLCCGRGMMPDSGAVRSTPIGDEEVSASTTLALAASRSGNDQELEALKAQAHATEQELRAIIEKVPQMQAGGRRRSFMIADVDNARCTGCGACAAICPMGAIAVDWCNANRESPLGWLR